MSFETSIPVMAKMVEIRETMRSFWSEEYQERIKPFRDAIRRWTAETGKSKGEVALKMCQMAVEEGTSMDVALAIAAFVEECATPPPAAPAGGER